MIDNSLFKIYRFLKRILLFSPPQAEKPFVLEEGLDDGKKDREPDKPSPLQVAADELNTLLTQARNLQKVMEEAQSALGKEELNTETAKKLAQHVDDLKKRQKELRPLTLDT